MARKFIIQGEVRAHDRTIPVYVRKRPMGALKFTARVDDARRYDTPSLAARDMRRLEANGDPRRASCRVVPEPVHDPSAT